MNLKKIGILVGTFLFISLLGSLIIIFEPPKGVLKGKVYSQNIPIYGANIIITGNKKLYKLKTDKNGNFNTYKIPSGTYDIKIKANGYKSISLKSINLKDNEIKNFDLSLSPLEPYLDVYTDKNDYLPNEKVFINVKTILIPITEISIYKLELKNFINQDINSSNLIKKFSIFFTQDKKNSQEYDYIEKKIELPLLKQGNYIVELKGYSIYKDIFYKKLLINITDIEFIIKDNGQKLNLFFYDKFNSKPLNNINILVYSMIQTKPIYILQTKTNANGEVSFYLPSFYNKFKVIAYSNTCFISNVFERTQIPKNYKIYTYTDKLVYLKGETVHFKGVIRAKYKNKYILPYIKSILVNILNPDNELIYNKELSISEFGSFNDKFILNKDFKSGEYKIKILFNSIRNKEKYIVPLFRVIENRDLIQNEYNLFDLLLNKDSYKINEIAQLTIKLPIKNVYVLYSIEGLELYTYKNIYITDNIQTIDIPVKWFYYPGVYVAVCFIYNNQLYIKRVLLKLKKDTNLIDIRINNEVKKGKNFYKIQTINKGIPLQTELSIGLIDNDIYRDNIYNYFYYPYNIDTLSSSIPVSYSYLQTKYFYPSIITDTKGEATIELPYKSKFISINAIDKNNNFGNLFTVLKNE